MGAGAAAPACDAGRELEEGGWWFTSVDQSPYKTRPSVPLSDIDGGDGNDRAIKPIKRLGAIGFSFSGSHVPHTAY
jgi:hypothetical protein